MNHLLIIAAVLAAVLFASYTVRLRAELRRVPGAELTTTEARAIALQLQSSGNARTVAAVVKLRAERR